MYQSKTLARLLGMVTVALLAAVFWHQQRRGTKRNLAMSNSQVARPLPKA